MKAFEELFSDLESDFDAVPVKAASSDHERRVKYPCQKCAGTGTFHWGYMNPRSGKCHACNGRGHFFTSEQDRAKARQQNQKRKERKLADNWESFAAEHPVEAAWLKQSSGNFASSLRDGASLYGSLTEGQLKAVQRIIADDAQKAAEREQEAGQTKLDMTDLLHRFEIAQNAGIKRPKVNTGDLLFTLAPASGRNAGCVYVKGAKDEWDERPYHGKITPDGRFYPARDLDESIKQRILEVGSDVVRSSKAYGAAHNTCCFCSSALTTHESVSNGYGPVCAERYGLPWVVTEAFKQAQAELAQANKESSQ